VAQNKPTVAQLIANLSFADVVDTMLVEGTSASAVAEFIQDDQGALAEINQRTLINALARRKRERQQEIEHQAAEEDEGRHWFDTTGGKKPKSDEGPKLPSPMSRAAYKRLKGGINELHELEGLYLSQRDRLDRLIQKEHDVGAFSELTNREIGCAASLLMQRVAVKEKMGVLDGERVTGDVKDFKGYSRETAEVLSQPGPRRRVISIVERIAENERARLAAATAEPEADEENQAAG
jgi:hypothetical protein